MSRNSHIYTFKTSYESGMGIREMNVRVFIDNLPPNSTATVRSTVEYSCSWFIYYSVMSCRGRTEFFYERVKDLNESSDYVLNISYDSTRAICSFDSSDQLTFVNKNNKVSDEQDQSIFYEYLFRYENDKVNEYKLFLVIYRNRIVLFWHDYYAEVIVKTLDLSSFDSFEDFDFTRVDTDITLFDFSLTFYTKPSCYNTYYSLDVSSESIIDSKKVKYVLEEHTFNIPCDSSITGSQFKPDTNDEITRGSLRMDCHVDGELQDDDSEDDSEAGSEAGSDYSEDDY